VVGGDPSPVPARPQAEIPTRSLVARWLTAERLRVYPRLLVAAYVAAALGLLLASAGGVDPLGKPLGSDFIAFYAGGKMALAGEAARAYDLEAARQAQLVVLPGLGEAFFGWYYPPTYFLLHAPLALLPYPLAWLVWMAGTAAVLALAVRPYVPESPVAAWLLLAAPAVFINALHGQNGFLTAGLFILALGLLDARPGLAGLCFGLLTLKPHLGVLVPLVLALTGRWRIIAAATATALLLVLLSVLLFGAEPWRVFLTSNATLLRVLLEQGALPWPKMLSPFAALSMLGAPPGLAWAGHAACALFAAVAVAWLWWRRAPFELAAAALLTGALIVSPHGFNYDLVLALPPVWLVARSALRTRAGGWLPLEREALLLAYLAPAAAGMFARLDVVPIAPAALVLLFLAILRRRVAGSATLNRPAPFPDGAASRPPPAEPRPVARPGPVGQPPWP
jgi:alpha-1,2-mannosyltransferase